jgi:hypothetical protein
MRLSRAIAVGLVAVTVATVVVMAAASLPRRPNGPAAAGTTTDLGQQSSFGTQASPPPRMVPPAGTESPDALGGCGVYVDQVDRTPEFYTVAGASELSQAVVAGDIVAIGKAHWATKDDAVPADEFGVHPSAADVYRVVDIHVDGIGMRSDARPVSVGDILHVRVLGGSIGCRQYVFSDDQDFVVGDEVVVFLGSQPTLSSAPTEDFDAVSVWRAEDGLVQSRDGLLSVDDVLQRSARSTE